MIKQKDKTRSSHSSQTLRFLGQRNAKFFIATAFVLLLLLICIVPVMADELGDVEWKPISSAEDLLKINSDGNYRLTNDIKLNDVWNIPSGIIITLDLNGYDITQTADYRVIFVEYEANLTITDMSHGEQGKITGGDSYYGGGVYVGGNFTLAGGNVSGNSVTDNGGGVYVAGSFEMSGGNIQGNNANRGGGVYICNGSSFILLDGNVSGNKATGEEYSCDGGGVYVASGSNFTQLGGSVDGNTAVYGGGVYVMVESNFTQTGGNVYLNTADNCGGGVAVRGTFLQWGGNVDCNNASAGGGVYVARESSNFTQLSGSVSQNKASLFGGGVYVERGSFTLVDGRVNGNSANEDGGGVFVENGRFTQMSGNVSHNSANKDGGGLYLSLGSFRQLGGNMSGNNATIDGGGVFICEKSNFTQENGNVIGNNAKKNGGGVYVGSGSNFTQLSGSVSHNIANENGGGVYVRAGSNFTQLSGNVSHNIANEDGGGVYIYNNDSFFRQLGGNVYGNHAKNGGGVVTYYGIFTQADGTVSGNNARFDGGGVYITGEHSSFTQTSGNVTGNECGRNGGGVYVNLQNNFTQLSGNVSENIAKKDGGGVYVVDGGEFNMSNGNVTGNEAGQNGGGVYVYWSSFKQSNGNVMGNTASESGGGVYVAIGGEFNMSNDATVDATNEVYLCKYQVIKIDGDKFTGHAMNITGDNLANETTVVEIDGKSEIKASNLIDKFDAPSDYFWLLPSGDKKLVAVTKPMLAAVALSLSTDIAVRFYVEDDELCCCSDPYVNLTFKGKVYKLDTPEDVIDGGVKYKVFTFKNISPAEMNDVMNAELWATPNGSGTPRKTNTIECSVVEYCKDMFDKVGGKTNLTTLCVDLLNYGAAAQIYINYNTSHLANETLTDDQKTWASADQTLVNGRSTTGEGTAATWLAASLNLYSDISVNFKFTSENYENLKNATITYGKYGLTTEVKASEFHNETYGGSKCKAIKFNEMNALDLNYPIVVTIYNNAGESSKTLTYSVESYSFAKQDVVDKELGNLVKSIMKYVKSVKTWCEEENP